MLSHSPRLPRFRRVPNAPSIQLTSRDQEIIRHVFRHRFLRSTQLTELLLGSRQHVLRRLQRLYHHGYLDRPRAQIERYTAGSKAMVYGIGKQGMKFLEEHLGIPRRKVDWTARDRSVNRYFLDHTLAVADILVKLEVACRADGRTQLIHARQPHEPPVHWQVAVRHHGHRVSIGVVPDAVFGLRTPGEPDAWFFLEADRATMPVARQNLQQTSVLRKLIAYHETWRQGVLKNRFPRFRTLTVTTSPQRVRNLLEANRAATRGKGSGLFLFVEKASLSAAVNALTVPLLNGRSETVSLRR